MKKILTKYGALAVALMVPLVQAQPAKFQAAFGEDAGTLSKKFTGLAQVYGRQVRVEAQPGRSLRR